MCVRVCVSNLAGASLPEPKRRRRDTGRSGAAAVLAARRRSRQGHGRTSVANLSLSALLTDITVFFGSSFLVSIPRQLLPITLFIFY